LGAAYPSRGPQRRTHTPPQRAISQEAAPVLTALHHAVLVPPNRWRASEGCLAKPSRRCPSCTDLGSQTVYAKDAVYNDRRSDVELGELPSYVPPDKEVPAVLD
jgi:hypothetical protein